ncbi:MAG: hypothetical protein ACYS74_13830, partial [Planctomycetota bacterium]
MITNDGDGRLSARIQIVPLQADQEFELLRDAYDQPIPLGEPFAAVPLPGSEPVSDVANGAVASFLWDVKETLGEDSAWVQAIVTPVEDGRDGVP